MTQITKFYTIPANELERLLLSCAAQNNCLTSDNKIKTSCICHQCYSKEMSPNESLPE
jgi:hypothetical protein